MSTTQTLRRMYAISEGPCFGLVDGLKSIKMNGTPILAADGTTYNYKNICVALVNGTKTQQSIKGFPDVETEFSVGSEITYSVPQYITVSDTSVNAVIVSITLPALQGIDQSTGKQIRKTVHVTIDVQGSGGGYVPQTLAWGGGEISDCASGSISRSFEIPLDGTGPWTLRVKRLTADSTDSYTQDKTYLGSYTEVKHAKLTNPWTAKLAISLRAEQFSSVPEVTLDYKGRIIKVPSNYDPSTRAYTGIWDGTFKEAWSDNPAWCFFDMATSARYGSGRYLDESGIDIWMLYEIAQYCDVLIDNGQGGTEPRCTFNAYLSSDEECFKVLAHIISVARAQIYYGASQDRPSTMLTAVQDAPGSIAALFSPSNVIGGKFTYSGTPRKTRYTEVTVWWNDPEQNYKLVPVLVVADASYIARYGVQSYETTAFGCTSKGQAIREGRRILYTNLLETGLLSFESGLEGMVVCPGQLIQIKDPARDRERKGGRLKDGCTTTTLALDGDVTLASGMAYTAYVTLPSGKVESRGITTAAGTVSSVALASALSSVPQAESQWQIVPTATAPTHWRVLGVKEKKSESSISYEISAVQNAPEKYALIETIGTIPSTPEDPQVVFAPVTGLAVTSNHAWSGGNSVITVQAAWTMPKDATGAKALIRIDTGAWQEMTVSGSSATFATSAARPVEVQVFAEYKRGTSVAATASYTIPAITTTTPATLTITRQSEFDGYIDADVGTRSSRIGGDPVDIYADYITATWAHTDANAFALKGFRVVIFTGADPNDANFYQCRPVEVGPSIRESTIRVFVGLSTTLNAAVQALYLDGNESAWRLASGAVVLDPDTITIATKAAVVAAQATATSAATSAATANSGLSTLNSDDVLSRAKKPQAITDYNAEVTTRAQLQAAALACSPAVDHSAYTAALDTLASFLGGLTPAWNDISQDTPLGSGGGATMRSRWATIAQQRTALQVSISSAQATKASNDAISAAAADATTKMNTATANALVQAPTLVAGLPGLPNASYPVNKMVFDSVTNRLYTNVANVWKASTATVPSADITGQLADAQVAAISASKVTGQMTDSQIQAVAAAKVAGTLVDSQIASGISAAKLTGSLSSATVPTAQLLGQVQASQIQANSIGAGQIAANSITTANLVMANLDNLIPNPNSEQTPPTGGWPTGAYEGAGVYSGDPAFAGTYTRRINSNGTFVRLPVTAPIPASAGDTFIFQAQAMDWWGSNGAWVMIEFFDTLANVASDTSLSCVRTQLSNSAAAWQLISVTGTAPAGTQFVVFSLNNTQVAGRNCNFDNLYARRCADASIIVDGSIVASKMAANSITAGNAAIAAAAIGTAAIQDAAITNAKVASLDAGKITTGYLAAGIIQAGSLDASKITAGTITSDRMTANTITGDRIQANTLDASKITANTITAGQISAGAIGATQIAANAITANSLTLQGDNLIPNPSCNLPTPSGGWPSGALETALLYSGDPDPNGTYLTRRINGTGNFQRYHVTAPIPCAPGDVFLFQGWMNNWGWGGGNLLMEFCSTYENALAGGSITYGFSPSGEGTVVSLIMTAPAGATYVIFSIASSQPAGQNVNFCNLLAKRCASSSLIVDGAVTAQKLAATLAITGVIQSPNWVAGAYGVAPQGFKLSGYAFTTTYRDGSTSANCYHELGGDANFGGYKVATVNDRVFQRFNRLVNGKFVYSAAPWALTAPYPLWSGTSKTPGTGSLETYKNAVAGSVTGTAHQTFTMPVSGGAVALSLTQGLMFANNAGTVTNEVKVYILNTATGKETLVATWTTTSAATDYALSWVDRTVDISNIVSAGGDFGIRLVHTVTASATTGGVNGYIDEISIVA